ncbi:Aerobic respiration control protein arcA [Escherichia coli]|nr:Aerobic respiration control protein arcA [Escherichia coli]
MQTPHILIVEDELVTRNTLKSIFEAEGYDVFEATDGAEMHQILSEYDINLVIMDINLPGKNGLLLARELREQANVALMFLTGTVTTKSIKFSASKSVQMTTSPNRSTRVN